jgi:hypothetical protein
MNEYAKLAEQRSSGEVVEQRSTSATIIQAVEAGGIFAGGVGTLAIGAAKVKEVFGSGKAPQEPPPPASGPGAREPRN